MMNTTRRLMTLNSRLCAFRGKYTNRVVATPSGCINNYWRQHSTSTSSSTADDNATTTTTSSSSLSSDEMSGSGGMEWRKLQLEKIKTKFSDQQQQEKEEDPSSLKIESDDELQEMWKQMESRVKNRRPRTLRETGGRTGRVNVKKTDEEMWLKEGLYSSFDDDDGKKN